MDTNTLTVAGATKTAASAPQNRYLSTDPKRRAVRKVREAIMRGAREYGEERGFVTVHNMPHLAGVTSTCGVTQFILGQIGIRECVLSLINRDNVM